jgi:hypothetical protein
VTNLINTQWQPFVPSIWSDSGNLFVGRNEEITCKSDTAVKRQFNDLFVFGKLLLLGPKRTLFSFRQIFVIGGLIECQGGITLRAARVVQMTLEQCLHSSPHREYAQFSSTHVKTDLFLTLSSRQRFYVNNDINHRFPELKSAVTGLLWATYRNDVALVALLIRAGADLDACTPDTALHWAVLHNCRGAITRLLVEAGADVTCVMEYLKKYKLTTIMEDFLQILESCNRPEYKKFCPKLLSSTSSAAPHINHRPLYFTHEELASFNATSKGEAVQLIKNALEEIIQVLKLRTNLSQPELKCTKRLLGNVDIGPYSTNNLVQPVLEELSSQIKRLNPEKTTYLRTNKSIT